MAIFSKAAIKKVKQKAEIQKQSKDQKTILLVDDEKNNLLALSTLLKTNYEVLTAEDGEAALELVKNHKRGKDINLIISDQRMPGMTGVEFLEKSLAHIPNAVRIILTGFSDINAIINSINKAKIFQYVTKPFDNQGMLLTVKRALEVYDNEKQRLSLVKSLSDTNTALQSAMKNLHTIKISNGVFWLQVPEADVYVLCGCPADVVKLMMRKGLISVTEKGGVSFETGPNTILLSEILIQNGYFSNLAEFPVLQMLYRQGMILPDHPNNKGHKPVLVGAKEQVDAQMRYIFRGNYGLANLEEIMQAGVDRETAREMMKLKLKFAFGKIRSSEELLDRRVVEDTPVEIRNGVFVRRLSFNRYEFSFKGGTQTVDLNLKPNEIYDSPYPLGFHRINREYFSVVHTGDGDGWDINRPCISSILVYQGKIYLIDAGPNILHALNALSVDISEIEGIFHTHAHDDHFAGLPTLIRSGHRIKYFATRLVRETVAKKLSALMSMDENKFARYFEVHDLQFDHWNDINGLEVKPIFSPHPIETNIFIFRTLSTWGYKTYAHWADIASFQVLKNMEAENETDESGISPAFIEKIKADYHSPADIKKLDAGGGMIHGQVEDYQSDPSEEIILAHSAVPFSERHKEIGSERSFASIDVMVPGTQEYLRKWSAHLLEGFFPDVTFEQLRILLNAPIISFNPGTIIQRKDEKVKDVYFLLTGIVEFINSALGLQNYLSNASFIGDLAVLKDAHPAGTWRTVSYVNALKFDAGFYLNFLEKFGLYDKMIVTLDKIDFLQNSYLFGESLSYKYQNAIARNMTLRTIEKGTVLGLSDDPGLYLVKRAEGNLLDAAGKEIDALKPGDFFGEETCFDKTSSGISVKFTETSEVYFIGNDYPLLNMPIVHWKLLEIHAKRKHMAECIDGIESNPEKN